MTFTNRLVHETSPYLRQHAHNPVDWHPWGPEALQKAKELDRPIFLSIGYSACHWCHVMEHESFEDPEVGRFLNDHFISIKVDREERPDLDQIYMAAVQLLTRHGGWPMTVFLTPGLKPFYGGTYFPPRDRHGLPSFSRLLQYLAQAWRERRQDIEEQANHVTDNMQAFLQLEAGDRLLNLKLLTGAGNYLRRAFDPIHGGFGQAPKFPHPMELRFLLRLFRRFHDDDALAMAATTLDQMARGGIYDQLGGGFHRYSTDARWLAPHFEKMLYDNALLALAYLEAHQATGRSDYRGVVEETLDYVLREMTSPAGPFYSTQDADSEGVEGKFFVWSLAEVESILGKEEAELFASVFDVTPEGNWEDHNILHRRQTDEQDARLLRMEVGDLRTRLAASKNKLLEARGRRIWPARDEKILTAWNGLMIAAFAQAGAVLDKREYVEAAVKAADYLLNTMRADDGRLYRTTTLDAPPKLNAYLEDYAYLIDALVTLHEATLQPRWIASAIDLTGIMVDQFWDAQQGGFFFTGKDHETLVARAKDTHDQATPSGNSMAVMALLRLAKLTGSSEYQARAEQTLELFAGLMEAHPLAAGQMLLALDFFLGPVREVVVVGNAKLPQTRQVWQILRGQFYPHQVLTGKNESTPPDAEQIIPLLASKPYQEKVATYVCENFACQAPLIGVEAVRNMTLKKQG